MNTVLILAQETIKNEDIKKMFPLEKIKYQLSKEFHDVSIDGISNTVVISVIDTKETEWKIGSVACNNFEIQEKNLLEKKLSKRLQNYLL